MAKLEICANSIESALNAQNGGADRVELCIELSVGGLTPSKGMIQLARELLDIPLYVLIRPHARDFQYSVMDLEIMKEDIAYCAEVGCNGVVVGVLTQDRKIDQLKTMVLMEAAGFMDMTFHRAFDQVPNHFEAMDTLRELGIQRVLTSGGIGNATDNIEVLGELIEEANDDIIIMPGGGIRTENLPTLLEIGASEYHSSALLKDGANSDLETIKQLKTSLS